MKNSAVSIEGFIRIVQGEKVILAADLATIYGVPTRVLNQAVKRNRNRFPADFCFQIGRSEWQNLRSQIVISNYGSRVPPWAFTEHGALMAANVLKSRKAIQMSVFVVRAFMKMRQALTGNSALADRLNTLEKEITGRLDSHEKAIVELMQKFLSILNPEESVPVATEKREMGFHVKDNVEGLTLKSKSRVRAR